MPKVRTRRRRNNSADFPDQADSPDQVVKQALHESGDWELRTLDVFHVADGLRVAGRVRSYFVKQKAQTIAMSVAPNHPLLNEVVVQ